MKILFTKISSYDIHGLHVDEEVSVLGTNNSQNPQKITYKAKWHDRITKISHHGILELYVSGLKILPNICTYLIYLTLKFAIIKIFILKKTSKGSQTQKRSFTQYSILVNI